MKRSLKNKFNILAIICIIVFGITLSQKTLQNDTYYTIKIGEHIVETKSVDMQDPFSWHEGLKYTYPHWLYDTGIYLIYNTGSNIATHFNLDAENGGLTAIYISTMILAVLLGVLIYITNIKMNDNHWISLILTLGTMYLLRNFIAARAQLVSYSLFVLEILFIEQFLKNKKIRYAVGLFIIATLIANFHAAVWYMFFILALPYIGEAFIIKLMESNLSSKVRLKYLSWRIKRLEIKASKAKREEEIEKINLNIEKLKNQKENEIEYSKKSTKAVIKIEENSRKIKFVKRENIKWLLLVLVICMFSGLITPQDTFEPYTHMIKLLKGNTTSSISEHLPLVLINSLDLLTVLTILGILLIFTDTKISLKDFFMLGGLILLTLMSRRQISMLALIGVFSLNRLITDFVNKYSPSDIEEKVIKKILTPFGVTVVMLLAIFCGISFYGTKYKEEYVDKTEYPVEAAQYILDNIDLSTMRLYNYYNFGSYLLYKDIPVFIDSRCDLYSPEFNERDIFTDALNIPDLNTYYEESFENYGITHIITYDDSKLKIYLEHDNNYKVLYEDENFSVFERMINKEEVKD